MRAILEILTIALIYCGTVFGAGFASGQEIFQFFSRWGIWGIFCSVLIGILFSVFGYIICFFAKKFQFQNAGAYFSYLFPKRLARTVSFICTSFLVVTFSIMISGCGTLLYEQCGVRPVIGGTASLLLCYWIMKNRVGGLAKLNAVLTPMMFLGVTVLCIMCLTSEGSLAYRTLSQGSAKAVLSGALYLSYNIVSAASVLVPCALVAKTPKRAGAGGVLGGILVAVPLVLLSVLLVVFPETQTDALPFFALVGIKYPALRFFCAVILFSAMLTTAASAGVSVLSGAQAKHTGKRAFFLCLFALFASLLPFSALVATMYTLFGLCGFVLVIGICYSLFRK